MHAEEIIAATKNLNLIREQLHGSTVSLGLSLAASLPRDSYAASVALRDPQLPSAGPYISLISISAARGAYTVLLVLR